MGCHTTDAIELTIQAVALVGGGVASGLALYQWRVGQRWQRAEQLDKFIERFETEPRLRLGSAVLDWTFRRVQHGDSTVSFKNEDVLLALRDHVADRVARFSTVQALIRDALDAVLTMFTRLEAAMSSGLLEARHARRYFRYWLERFIKMDMHPLPNDLVARRDLADAIGDRGPEDMASTFMVAYAELSVIENLCRQLEVAFPRERIEAARKRRRSAIAGG